MSDAIAYVMHGVLEDGSQFEDVVLPIVPENCSLASRVCTPQLCLSVWGACFRQTGAVSVRAEDEVIPRRWLIDNRLLLLNLATGMVRLIAQEDEGYAA